MSKLLAVMVGLPGSGKSTMGRLLAERHSLPFADTDSLISKRAGKPIPQIFADDGEAAFRALETEVVTEALSDGRSGVISLGGGAIGTPAIRRALRGHMVVEIAAPLPVLVERVSRHPSRRPLLADNPETRLAELAAVRQPLYKQVANVTVMSDARPAAEVAADVDAAVGAPRKVISVDSYDVEIGRNLSNSMFQACAGASAAAVVVPEGLRHLGNRAVQGLIDRHIPASLIVVPNGEAQKSSKWLVHGWDVLGEAKLGRDGVILAIGGGATTDFGGFLAATWLRGIDVVQVPTSLLAMVDAAVGGKTGIDTSAGKNLVGAFHTPSRVIVDLNHLETLPPDELRAGLAEAIKCGFIADMEILRAIESAPATALQPTSGALSDIVERAVAVKADVVRSDLREQGRREFLNYGHTLAHAIEKVENFTVRHGDAVAIGCMFAARLSERAGLLSEGEVARHRRVLEAVGLPTAYRTGRRQELLNAMRSDKKVRSGTLRFVVLNGIGNPEILTDPDSDWLDAAFEEVGA